MENRKCIFCGHDIEPASGIIYIRKDGNIMNFCSKKCRVNMIDLKRAARNVKWTNEYHRIKEMRKA
ncbi:MAG: 50S ribosomal protein L24e [Candidatus Thermoplasmatota archaeon]|jgi:large subunit ribosomal protein L24e|uniref:Large ribosomal subunit protein eL24 n=2 Tax=Ferroplasma TaxID=74968 RepID=S0AS07_FERAC|nr:MULTISPECIES: 50S ribosomal protein L24e [Ferroplasma]MCL4311832.1 50S ribosomal protein L24e [Candidatus Thermoplasmatota archaeon]AGO61592.1 hypothetical protein FACI_IFERC00001G1612 [Ferroplasma acidarmanus Fer1]ARD84502.1 50S ribosomal protein L24e [Ferroplasma acidiphilum]EQB67828.1 MAG: hypothetical protein AMDU4_FER2C00337G0003 [Ferroplasma sp. Type II]MCL4349631.1 50S ribosomal protein L24e [Candidatus Thermoplasmatota archaeon]